MKLSILIPVHINHLLMFNELLINLQSQIKRLGVQKEVEIVTIVDSGEITLGEKRNQLVNKSKGDYLVSVDADDTVTENYVERLLEAIKEKSDVINYTVAVSLNGGEYKPCYYRKGYQQDFNIHESYHRLPNHICCVKREIAIQVPYDNVAYGEDAIYSKKLRPFLKTETNIDEVLYYYNFNVQTSESQKHLRNGNRHIHTK